MVEEHALRLHDVRFDQVPHGACYFGNIEGIVNLIGQRFGVIVHFVFVSNVESWAVMTCEILAEIGS